MCETVIEFKVLDQIQKSSPTFLHENWDFGIRTKLNFFSDYCGEILGLKYVSLRCDEQKSG